MLEITDEIIASFRDSQPGFLDAGIWPNIVVRLALEAGDSETGGRRWGQYEPRSKKQRGMFLFAAHWLVTSYPKGAQDESMMSPSAQHPVNSKSIGDQSTSWAVPTANSHGESWLSSTQFGQQFQRIKKRVGIGAIAV